MKMLLVQVLALVALVSFARAASALAAASASARAEAAALAAENADCYLPEVDENGYRCEGDCDENTPCRFCNPK